MENANQLSDRDDDVSADASVHEDLEPQREDMEDVTGGRDAATGLPTGKRMHKP